MIVASIIGFLFGISPLFIVISLLYSNFFLKLIQKHNSQKISDLKNKRTPSDDANTYQPNCRINTVKPTSFDCEIYFDDNNIKPLNAVISTDQKSIILNLSKEEEYHIFFTDITSLLINGNLFRFLPNDRLTIISNHPILPNTSTVQIHFTSGIVLEHFYYSLLQQLASTSSSQLITLNPSIFPNVPNDMEKARRSIQFKEHFVSLLSRLDHLNTSESLEWFYGVNYLAHRIFFTFHDNNTFLSLIKRVVQTKIEKSSLPSFVESVSCTDFQMGPSLPVFNDPSVRTINSPNKTFLEAVIHYLNGFKMKFQVKVRLLFGSITLNAEVKLNNLHSMIRVMFQDLPTNIVWFGFLTEPVVDLDIVIPTFRTQNMPEKIQEKIEGFLTNFIQKEILGSFVIPSMKSIEIPDVTGKMMLTAIDNRLEIFKNEMPTAIEDYHRHKKFFKRISELKKNGDNGKKDFIKFPENSKTPSFPPKQF